MLWLHKLNKKLACIGVRTSCVDCDGVHGWRIIRNSTSNISIRRKSRGFYGKRTFESTRVHSLQRFHSSVGSHVVIKMCSDVTSNNIMMADGARIKLIDFGLCADISKGPKKRIAGTLGWIVRATNTVNMIGT